MMSVTPVQSRCTLVAQRPSRRCPPARGAPAPICCVARQEEELAVGGQDRRTLLTAAAAAAVALAAPVHEASALGFQKDLTNKRRQKIDPALFKDGPQGLKYYDLVVGSGLEAKPGQRVVVHFEAKWRGITFVTTRQGMGAGGDPFGFNVGAEVGSGGTLKGLDLGVRGMRVGGRRKLKVPPELAYGSKGYGEIPPNTELEIDVDLLSVKNDSTSRIL